MSDLPVEADEGATTTSGAAASMKAAREAAGLTLKEIADTTRVPLRQLSALEEGDFGAMPSTTYVAGFARSYARAVGMDEAALVAQLRSEISEMGGLGQGAYEFEEAVNPARVPPRRLAWTVAAVVVLLAAAFGVWRMQLMTPPTDDEVASNEQSAVLPANQAAPTPQTPVATGPVVMTAADDVWLRIYQPDGTRLYEGTLKRGDSYTVPDNARDPMILTGRPDALAVTVGGRAIPPLGTAERTISDLPVNAAALLARSQQPVTDDAPATPTESNAAAPVAPSTARPAPQRSAAPAAVSPPQVAVPQPDEAATAP